MSEALAVSSQDEIRIKVSQLYAEALQLEAETMQRYRAIGEILETAVASGQISNFNRFVDEELPLGRSCSYECRRIYKQWDLIEKLVGVSRIGPRLALKALGRYEKLGEGDKPSLMAVKPPKVYPAGTIVKVNNPTLPFHGQLAKVAEQKKLLHFVVIPGEYRHHPLFPSELEAVDVESVTVFQPRKRKSKIKSELASLIEQWRGKLPEEFLEKIQELVI